MTKYLETLFVWFAMAILAYFMLLMATMTTLCVLDIVDHYRVSHARTAVTIAELAAPTPADALVME